jgi:hypothetical protein
MSLLLIIFHSTLYFDVPLPYQGGSITHVAEDTLFSPFSRSLRYHRFQ